METFASKEAKCFRKSHLEALATALEKSEEAPNKFKTFLEHRELNRKTALRIKVFNGLQQGGKISKVRCRDYNCVFSFMKHKSVERMICAVHADKIVLKEICNFSKHHLEQKWGHWEFLKMQMTLRKCEPPRG